MGNVNLFGNFSDFNDLISNFGFLSKMGFEYQTLVEYIFKRYLIFLVFVCLFCVHEVHRILLITQLPYGM